MGGGYGEYPHATNYPYSGNYPAADNYYRSVPNGSIQGGIPAYLAPPPNPYAPGHPGLLRTTSDPSSITGSDSASIKYGDGDNDDDEDELATLPVAPSADEMGERASGSSATLPRNDSDADSTDSIVSSLRSRSPRRRSGPPPPNVASSPGSVGGGALNSRGKARSPAPYDIPPPRGLRGRVSSDPRAGPYGGGRGGNPGAHSPQSQMWPAPGRSATASQAIRGRRSGHGGGDEEVVDILTSMGRGVPTMNTAQSFSGPAPPVGGGWWQGSPGYWGAPYGYPSYPPQQPPYGTEWYGATGDPYAQDPRNSFYAPPSYPRTGGFLQAPTDYNPPPFPVHPAPPPPAVPRLDPSSLGSDPMINSARSSSGGGLAKLPSVSSLLSQLDGASMSDQPVTTSATASPFIPNSATSSPNASPIASTRPPNQHWRGPHRSSTDGSYNLTSSTVSPVLGLSPMWDKTQGHFPGHSLGSHGGYSVAAPQQPAGSLLQGQAVPPNFASGPSPRRGSAPPPSTAPSGPDLSKMDDDRVMEAILAAGTANGGEGGKGWDGVQGALAEIAMLV
ncbi:hypothetical protein M427DRAFT_131813 [Gonapodya prolifera JEL478]|uniref:Uncharacterized protein n=1 Tax=Gonapodya prolifera (strain JEL478) TaxID=1344416 RepID=A0A139AT02_GONPJ|nr:hypothetical protein M427DRAFT_131813 [Gonapodya prolifera JEL478]|eukprot:KXS19858.1 hypothetical protein M427DRAFT_131813 [Gonapodya prolifera JEL478]